MGFQPIVALETQQVVGFEALVRPELETGWADPGALFAGARAEGRLTELDRACRRSALQVVAAAGLPEGTAVFLNAEAASLAHPAAEEDVLPGLFEDTRCVRLVLELTERELAARPAELLASVQRAREHGWRIALEDVGAARSSLALKQLVRPDVVKLDLQLMQRAVGQHTAEVVNAVAEQAERSGALILAEGIETPAMLETALAMGATLGQGLLFGRAAPLPDPVVARRPMRIPRLTGALGRTDQSPFAAIARRLTTRP
jgi:EAL domain-containing protein (putative c-di-GMP-specific phosphodiesterase class I)